MVPGRDVLRLAALVAAALLCVLAASGCSSCSKSGNQAAADAGVAMHDPGDASADASATLDDTAMPASTGDDLQARMRHLLEAVAQNNPDLATDAVFPRDAYIVAKEAADPQKAWDKRVSGLFKRGVERTHKRMKGIEHAKFVSFELGRSIVQLTPSKKDFKKPLWRVRHSKLSFTIDGKIRHLDVAEMTAWRGAWYVTRLR